ncbi:MAG: class I SAM-dependent methyltransferase [Clostridia bacterium]|nr:class I SAM-dependent methyltransferase [Clostridia bacterium]
MYTAFASVYDRLTADVDYPAWADFYEAMMNRYAIGHGKVCECACGTGNLTILLAKKGYQMTGVDISTDMLFEASQKARKDGAMIPFVKQDMRSLHLHRQMDAVLCTNDGVNYLPAEEDISAFFRMAYQALRLGGCLFFDLSTPHKLEHTLGDHFWGQADQDIAYLWQNHFSKNKQAVDLDLTIFVKQKDHLYLRIEEHQRQYAYPSELLVNLLAGEGFSEIALYGDRTFQKPDAREKRWHIAARKPRHSISPNPSSPPMETSS